MKKLLIALLLISVYTSSQAGPYRSLEAGLYSDKDSITLDQLVAMDKKQFRGKTLANFLDSREANGYTQLIFKYDQQNVLQAIRLKYTNQLYLNIYLQDLQHTDRHSASRQWDLEKLRHELVEDIRVVFVMSEG